MILVDTSVWVDHLRVADARLVEQLHDGQVLCHAFVIGELACGNLRRRVEILSLLVDLPQLPALPSEEVMQFIDAHRLMGKGLGWVDMHLLASAFVSREALWTKDRRLADTANRLGVAW
ncbi:MAG TPA: type II toxin-antitoxin system VapC family toxin [Vicinamibacterales bacterium]|jgi:predicted nucleic acid-binding protein|nr:type II toxin-antitoxin system VapC family toxin [Vicinamibacterales bacterium]HXR43230.1 type II toxin-antitoxin system VapC family toxin [Pseudolysinimonas sp.]